MPNVSSLSGFPRLQAIYIHGPYEREGQVRVQVSEARVRRASVNSCSILITSLIKQTTRSNRCARADLYGNEQSTRSRQAVHGVTRQTPPQVFAGATAVEGRPMVRQAWASVCTR